MRGIYRADNDAGSHFFIGQGAYHVYIQGGDYANETDASQPTIGDTTCGCGNWPPAEDVHVSGAVVHDFVTTSPSHGDGFFIAPSYGVQIVKNVLARNDCIPVYVNYLTGNGQPVGVHGLRVIGNVVHTDTMHNGGDRCYQGISLGNNNQTDTIVAFNTLELPIRRSNSTETNQSIRIVGNIAEGVNALNSGNSWGCGSGTTAAYNILMNSSVSNCGDASNAIGATLPFVSADAQPNSPAGTNQYFTAPLGDYTIASGSAGAPAVGKVPTNWCNANPGVCPPPTSMATRAPTLRTPPTTTPAPTRTADGAARLVDAKQLFDEVAGTQDRRDADDADGPCRVVQWSSSERPIPPFPSVPQRLVLRFTR